jgi:chromosome segregation protein
VLGEREAKQLRGMTLENLIFAGTPKRPSAGFAKVALHFDNSEGLFPIDTKEVVLSRRVDRSGLSQFLLNDDEIKLKDLLPLLARAKLAARGLTMIGQGQSTMFVESSPEERRIMIEEILGLKEFRMKKHDAERRLNSSETNIEKVRAMLEELTPHLNFLRRQRKKWEKRSEIERELRSLENAFYAGRYKALCNARDALKKPTDDLRKNEQEKKGEISLLEEKIQELKKHVSESDAAKKIREEIGQAFAARAALDRELARVEVRLELTAETAGSKEINPNESLAVLRSAADDLRTALSFEHIQEIKNFLEGLLKKIERLFSEEGERKQDNTLIQEKEKLSAERDVLGEKIKKLETEEENIAESQRRANEEFRAQIEAIEEHKNEARTLEQTIQSQIFEYEKINIKIEEVEREWLAFGREKEELAVLPVPDESISLDADTERKMFRLRGQLAEVGEIDEATVKEAEESEERYTFLSREIKDLESAIADLKKLIKDLDERIRTDFEKAFYKINEEFHTYFGLMFGGGRAKLKIERAEPKKIISPEGEEVPVEKTEAEEAGEQKAGGVLIEVSVPKKKITNLEMLSGGEKSLVSMAALFALISVSPPPFLVLDEIDAALDESNARRFSELVKKFSEKTQFIMVTHNRATMEAADALYGVTMADDGVSKILSMRFAEENVDGKGGIR